MNAAEIDLRSLQNWLRGTASIWTFLVIAVFVVDAVTAPETERTFLTLEALRAIALASGPALLMVSASLAIEAVLSQRRVARTRATYDHIQVALTDHDHLQLVRDGYRLRDLHGDDLITAASVGALKDDAGFDARSVAHRLVNYYEHTALAIERGALDKDYFEEWWRSAVVADWNDFRFYVRDRRRKSGDEVPGFARHFETLALEWGGDKPPGEDAPPAREDG